MYPVGNADDVILTNWENTTDIKYNQGNNYLSQAVSMQEETLISSGYVMHSQCWASYIYSVI